ncbi:uncharacterized protein BT62DRAFT_921374 [Guyanagaster necrorhizus]|uniref:Uncharacterized protein n=1 Tax=Guyanagaster necrorhizus TaxID=856835 RepID=A0A9P7VQE0_9AGAR|nr:uncharacterized protein BT62DRAFT_921374 [Guyanagaster necrorhizus MCA 3950]KAG7444089.1 hypothetical protein BT62DRAFT_921374 [Guyanagaster necrorhizus MCA 3950]
MQHQKAQVKKRKEAPTVTSEQHGKLVTLQQHIEVLDWYHANGKNQSKIVKHFNAKYPHLKIKQLLVSAWIKAEDKWREEHEKSGVNGHQVKCMHQTQHLEITEMMDLWITKAMADAFANLKRVSENKRLDEEQECIKAILAKYELCDIYNMDETGLFYSMSSDCGFANKNHSGVKKSKVHLTYAFTVNANSSDKKEPFIFEKAHKPHSFQKKSDIQLGFYYHNNAKA